MEDSRIVELYWARAESAISETASRFGRYCHTIAFNILRDRWDSEECVNDTWLRAWNTMPPQRPGVLSAFLSRITRNLSLDRYKAARAAKRGGGQLPVALEELGDCIPTVGSVEETIELRELTRILDSFLRELPEKEACVFLRRYWYLDSLSQIAHRYHMTEGCVKTRLHRIRKKLKAYLEQEGYEP